MERLAAGWDPSDAKWRLKEGVLETPYAQRPTTAPRSLSTSTSSSASIAVQSPGSAGWRKEDRGDASHDSVIKLKDRGILFNLFSQETEQRR